MPEVLAEIPVERPGADDRETIFAISMEESRFTLNGALAAAAGERPDDGRDRWPPAGYGRESIATLPGVDELVSRAAAQEGDERDSEARRASGSRKPKSSFPATTIICSSSSASACCSAAS